MCVYIHPLRCSAGVLDTRTALQLVRYLPQEREYVPWRAALDWLYTLSGRLSLTPAYGVYRVSLAWDTCSVR